jgi:nicotinamide-nucleotide amidase
VRFYFLPGVPDQMRFLMDECVLPDILSHSKTLPVLRHRLIKIYGLNEPAVAEILKKLPDRSEKIILGFYPRFPENHITLALRGLDEPSVTRELDVMEKEIRNLVGTYVFASGNESMEGIVGRMLQKRGMTLSVAESCTGGLIGNLLTNVPGSSAYFLGGVVVYSNRSKVDLLGVSAQMIDRRGAVSDPVVRQMAEGVRERFKTDLSVAVTGIAGPEGGSLEKPVGTVYIGLAGEGKTVSRKYRFWGTRKQVKVNSAVMALDWIRRYLHGDSFLPGF